MERFEDKGDFMSTEEYLEERNSTFFIFPRIDNINFPREMDYIQFCERCRAQGICYDIYKKSGTLFLASNSITKGALGVIIIGKKIQILLTF